jgi:hypothetical protein
MGDIGQGRIVFHELREIGKQTGAIHKAHLEKLPWITVSGVVAPGYPVMQDTSEYVEGKEKYNIDRSDPAASNEGDLQQSVYDQQTIAYKQ